MAVGFWDKVKNFGGKVKQGLGKAFNFAQKGYNMGKSFLDANPQVKSAVSGAFERFGEKNPTLGKIAGSAGNILGNAQNASHAGQMALGEAAGALKRKAPSMFGSEQASKQLKGAQAFKQVSGTPGGGSRTSIA